MGGGSMLPSEILWWLADWVFISLLAGPLIGKIIRGPK